MSFSATSLFLIFLVLGQLSQETGPARLARIDNTQELHQALAESCQTLLQTGPLAEIDVAQLIEFQRESYCVLSVVKMSL